LTEITGVHPLADLFPMMSDPELRALAEDIKDNGLREPIKVTKDGVLVEGRNRLKACELVGIEPATEIVNGDIGSLIVSANIMRRHMTKGQVAILAVCAELGIDLSDNDSAAAAEGDGSSKSRKTKQYDYRERAHRRVVGLVSPGLIDSAAKIVRWAPDLALSILATGEGLRAAEQVAAQRSADANSENKRRAIMAEDSPELLAQVSDTAGGITLAEAWRLRESRMREEREKKVRLTGYLVQRVSPLLGKTNPEELIEHYDPELADRKIGTAELDEAIEYLKALRREIVKQRKDTNV